MKLFRLPRFAQQFTSQLFDKKQCVCWFSSQQLFLLWDGKKRQLPLNTQAGFAAGQINDEQQAVNTLAQILEKEGLHGGGPLAQHSATVFIATGSSPLERSITRRVFQKAGFSKVSLVAYATAIRAFAQRQDIQAGVGCYFGDDLSEAVIFSPDEQATFNLEYSLGTVRVALQRLLREKQQLEISAESARKLYLSLGKKNPAAKHVIRGRNIQTQQVETRTLSNQDLGAIDSFFQTQLRQELQVVTAAALFETINPDHWIVVGDGFINDFVQQTYQAKTVFLRSAVEMIQGVQWL